MEPESEPPCIYLEIEQAGSVETLPLQKMTLGSGEGDAVPIAGLPKAFASVSLDRAGGYRIRVNEPGQGLFVESEGEWASELALRDGVVFRMGMARVRCCRADGRSPPGESVVPAPANASTRPARPSASGAGGPGPPPGTPSASYRGARQGGMWACLRGRDPEARSFHLELEETLPESGEECEKFVVGRSRDQCRLILDNTSVSRRHAVLTIRRGGLFVEDLGSNNGTEVNGRSIRPSDPPHALRTGDRVKFGEVTLVVDVLRSGAPH